MKRARTYLVVVGAVSALAGLVIAGYPSSAHPLVLDRATVDVALAPTPGTDAAATNDPTSTTAATTTVGAPTTTGTIAPPQPTTTTVVSTSTTAVVVSTLPAPTTTLPTPTVPTTTATTTTAAATTTAPADGLVDRAAVRLVVANGDGRFNLVTRNANRLRDAGYTEIRGADVVPDDDDPTVIFYRPGFEEEAARAGADVGVPAAATAPLPNTPVTVDDEFGDLIIVLGTDALR